MNRFKSILIVALTLLAAGAVYLWFYPLNKGDLLIKSEIENYTVIANRETFDCPTKACEIRLNSGAYSIEIQKENYFAYRFNELISRGDVKEVPIRLEKVPRLIVSPIIPDTGTQKKPAPDDLRVITYSWNQDESSILYLDANDERLKKRASGGPSLITQLKGLSNLSKTNWSPNEKLALISDLSSLYWIDLDAASRKKLILNFIPNQFSWNPDSSYALISDGEDNVYSIKNADLSRLNKSINLLESAWGPAGELIFLGRNEDRERTIESLDPITKESKLIMTPRIELGKMTSDKEGTMYFFSPNENTWYYLDF